MSGKKKVFEELCNLFKDKKITDKDEFYGYGDDGSKLYQKLYETLEKAGCIDYEYIKTTDKMKYADALSKVDSLTFKQCCAYLTFILRADRWTDGGWLAEVTNNGQLYKLLKRAYETA